jgi:hypothetical protein
MQELWLECIKTVNLPYSLLFAITLFYWLLYIVGALGSDFLDFMDFDTDADLDGDMDPDMDVGHHGGILASTMKFMHAGEVPATIIASCLNISMWAFSILLNHYLENTNVLLAAGLFFPILLAGMLMTRVSLAPFVPLLKKAFDESGDVVEVIGKLCTVTSLEVTSKYGQAELPLEGSPLLLHVKIQSGDPLKKGEEAVIFGHDKKEDVYLITRYEESSAKLDLAEDDAPSQK